MRYWFLSSLLCIVCENGENIIGRHLIWRGCACYTRHILGNPTSRLPRTSASPRALSSRAANSIRCRYTNTYVVIFMKPTCANTNYTLNRLRSFDYLSLFHPYCLVTLSLDFLGYIVFNTTIVVNIVDVR